MHGIISLLLCVYLATCEQNPLIKFPDGKVEGRSDPDTGVRSFLKIPYAQPPVGKLRFRSPQRVKPWSDVYNAMSYAPSCPQVDPSFITTAGTSEDCLYLQVVTPPKIQINKTTTPNGLPVMVFIYGGAFNAGSYNYYVYNGAHLLQRANNGIVYVAMNYRVNAFGFLGAEYMRDPQTKATGNWGFEDQTMALEWVKHNIQYFGGDPTKVTIFGESAGAASVALHLVSPTNVGQNLFRGAISESGAAAFWSSRTVQAAEYNTKILVDHLKESACPQLQNVTNNNDVVDCLQRVSVKDIQAAFGNNTTTISWSPVIDGVNFPEDPQLLAMQGKFERVPYITGTNTNEANILVLGSYGIQPNMTTNAVQTVLNVFLAQSGIPRSEMGVIFSKYYPVSNYRSPYWALMDILTDIIFVCPARRNMRWFLSVPDAAPQYMYHFAHELEWVKRFKPSWGVFHGSELLFVYDDQHTSGIPLSAAEMKFASVMSEYWVNFAMKLTPTCVGQPSWPTYNNDTAINLRLNFTITTETNFKNAKCDFLDSWLDIHTKMPHPFTSRINALN